MFKNHNVCMAVGRGLIIVSILIMCYSLWVSVPNFMIGGYLAFIKAPQRHLHNMPGRERVGEEGIVTKAQTVSRNSRWKGFGCFSQRAGANVFSRSLEGQSILYSF